MRAKPASETRSSMISLCGNRRDNGPVTAVTLSVLAVGVNSARNASHAPGCSRW